MYRLSIERIISISIYIERAVDPLPLLLGGGEQTGASQTDRQTDGWIIERLI